MVDKDKFLSIGIVVGLLAFSGLLALGIMLPAKRPLAVTTEYFKDAALTFVSSTEYMPYEPIEVITRLTDMKGSVIPANCSLSIAYPDLTLWINGTLMTTPSPFLNHYWQGTAQSQIGVYEILVNCTSGGKNYADSKTFHVSNSTPFLAGLINLSEYDLTAYMAAQFNSTNSLITANFNSTNSTNQGYFQNISSTLTIILNSILYPCAGQTNLTTGGLNYSRIGEPFFITAEIVDACGHPLSNFSCTADTGGSFWGVVSMPFSTATHKYEYSLISDKSGTVNWQVSCT